MSLPPLNPERTASGIIVDPRTLERVIPQSKRKDGTVRKEQKVRPGFTPQEDVGRFRSSRQAAEDARASSRPTIPGSNRLGPQASKGGKEENVFASEPREKTKAQIKNEKRREKRREKVAVSWDEDDDEDDDVGALDEEFKKVDIARQNGDGKASEKGAEQSFPPLENDGGVPNESILDDITEREHTEGGSSGKTAAIEPAPPAPSGSQPETALEQKTTEAKPSLLNDRKNEVQQKPHPIQGGRKGPIGLANPPPIEEPRPSRADTNDWRTAGRKPSRGGRQQSNRGGSQNQGNRQSQSQGNKQNQNQPKPTPAAQPQSQPRERKEYKVREGGANDISSLASRVKNLVVANTVGNASREGTKKDDGKASA